MAGVLQATVWAGEPVSVSGLKKGESIEVRFSSRGCFHSGTELIVIADGFAKFSDLEMKWDEVRKESVEVSRKVVGEVKLDERDAVKLDKLFEFYAGEPGSGCTTVDAIKVRVFRNGECVRSVLYEDGSCGTYEMEGVLTFPALKRRLETK